MFLCGIKITFKHQLIHSKYSFFSEYAIKKVVNLFVQIYCFLINVRLSKCLDICCKHFTSDKDISIKYIS